MTGLKAIARNALCQAYLWSGAARVQEYFAPAGVMAILLFHRVTDAIPEDGLTVSTTRFRGICSLLQRRFHVVPLSEVFRLVRSGGKFPPRTVAVTFDDSYRDNLDAARVLAEFGLHATFFIPSGFVGTDRVFDWDRGLPHMPNLSWPDVREMAALGHGIGSHTVSHANLGAASPEQARREIFESKRALEGRAGVPVRHFAFPFGGRHHFRPEWLPMIQEAGYEGAVSAYGGFVRNDTNRMLLPREAVPYFKSAAHLELHLAGCFDWLYRLRGREAAALDTWHLDSSLARDDSDAQSAPAVPATR